jgi:hypothetical protein
MQQPEDERQDNTNDQARCDRKIEAKVAALDQDIAGQSTETELAEPGPQQADNDERQTDRNEPFHKLLSTYPITEKRFN